PPSTTVPVHITEDRRRPLAARRALIRHDDFAAVRAGPDGDAAKTATRCRDRLLRAEWAPSAETRYRRPARHHTPARVPIDPHATVTDSDRGLVNTAAACGYWCTERGTAVGTQNHVNLVNAGVDIHEEQIAKRVPGSLSVATCHAGSDRAARPCCAGIC